jgi:hypothetical protein
VPGALCVAFRNRVGVVHFIVSDVRIGEGSPALAHRLAGLADLGLFWRGDAATALFGNNDRYRGAGRIRGVGRPAAAAGLRRQIETRVRAPVPHRIARR